MKLTQALIPALALLLLLNSCGTRDDPQPHENPPPSVEITEPTQERREPVEEETDPVNHTCKDQCTNGKTQICQSTQEAGAFRLYQV